MEQTINNILEISQLSSFKIAGNGPRTTIVLRFDECMADASVSPIHRSTPRNCYRRKPPIQMRRDRERMEQHRNFSAEKIVHENNSSRQYNKDENVNRICNDDSALHSMSFFETAIPARREKAQDNIQQVKRPASAILSLTDIKEDEEDRDDLQLFGFDLHKETTKTEETRVKTHNQSTVLVNSQDTASVCQRSHSTPNTPEQRNQEGQDAESSLQKSSLETRLRASEPIHTNNTGPECSEETCVRQDSADNPKHEHSEETDESTNSETNESTEPPQDLMLERKPKDTQRSNRVPCDEVQIRIIDMKHDTRQLISQPERNNSFRKIILDTYNCKCVMVAETRGLDPRILHDNRENNKSVCQGRRGGKPLRQDEKTTFERLARRHFPHYRRWIFRDYFRLPKTTTRTETLHCLALNSLIQCVPRSKQVFDTAGTWMQTI